MASLVRPTLPASLSACNATTQSPKSANNLFKSSQSHFHGLNLSLSIPSLVSSFTPSIGKTSLTVSAKVNKGSVPLSFTLKDQDGKTVSLSKFKGKPVVVYFHLADETPGYTKQACALRDSYEKFKKVGAQVVEISGDDAESHKTITLEFGLTKLINMLKDSKHKVFVEMPGKEQKFLKVETGEMLATCLILRPSIATQGLMREYMHGLLPIMLLELLMLILNKQPR